MKERFSQIYFRWNFIGYLFFDYCQFLGTDYVYW